MLELFWTTGKKRRCSGPGHGGMLKEESQCHDRTLAGQAGNVTALQILYTYLLQQSDYTLKLCVALSKVFLLQESGCEPAKEDR